MEVAGEKLIPIIHASTDSELLYFSSSFFGEIDMDLMVMQLYTRLGYHKVDSFVRLESWRLKTDPNFPGVLTVTLLSPRVVKREKTRSNIAHETSNCCIPVLTKVRRYHLEFCNAKTVNETARSVALRTIQRKSRSSALVSSTSAAFI